MVSGNSVIAIAVFCLFVIAITGVVLLAPKKTDLVGGTCGTVSPDSRDECCAMRNENTSLPQCAGNWKWQSSAPAETECAYVCASENSNQCGDGICEKGEYTNCPQDCNQTLGASCGTVTPGQNDACCEQRNINKYDVMCVGKWKYSPTGDPSTECSWECVD